MTMIDSNKDWNTLKHIHLKFTFDKKLTKNSNKNKKILFFKLQKS